eukprot:CAMPEP_0114323974 /NCGR_PEP_ID=MMETSP0059-20121206/28235_1 /TAXON_ID=36894 /ORGANISM="Pyramimonas parkeae, Strain CCMP726" /LENGTH=74 /DNA_ID=CAMNT_0001452433 /DNA_START=1 /DNA_END=222 /DNA_ORIENTATION=-
MHQVLTQVKVSGLVVLDFSPFPDVEYENWHFQNRCLETLVRVVAETGNNMQIQYVHVLKLSRIFQMFVSIALGC